MKVATPGGWHSVYNSTSQGLSVNRFVLYLLWHASAKFDILSYFELIKELFVIYVLENSCVISNLITIFSVTLVSCLLN